jgi:anti-sigma regulatory factor (Ser/Thr protein kinase)
VISRYAVTESLDVFEVRRRATLLADRVGFARNACLELALVVSELATNILKYGARGSIELRTLRDRRRGVGIEVIARDEGPPFADLSIALRDGCDDCGPIDAASVPERGGLGAGLGAVVRFSHELRVEPEATGKRIVVTRYLAPPTASFYEHSK